MDKYLLETILSLHADRLDGEDRQLRELLDLFPDEREEISSLMDLAQRLADALIPVKPAAPFREGLHNSLLTAAHQKHAQPAAQRSRLRSPWALALAGIASAVSVAVGVITYYVLSRIRANPMPPG